MESVDLVQDLKRHYSLRTQLRIDNEPDNVDRLRKLTSLGQGANGKLKSDIKKSSAFVKKLKTLSESNVDSLQKDIFELNLTRYVSECVASIVEAPLKMADISAAVKIISILHQRYSEFTQLLTESLQNAFDSCYSTEDKQKIIKRRIFLRLLAELLLVRVTIEHSIILTIIQKIVRREYASHCGANSSSSGSCKGKRSLANLNIPTNSSSSKLEVPLLVGFAKYCGLEYLGVIPRKLLHLETDGDTCSEWRKTLEEQQHLVPSNVQEQVYSCFKEAYDMICKYYGNQHVSVCKLQARNEKEELNRGEINERHVEELDKSRALFEKLQTSLSSLAEALDREVPSLPQHEGEADKNEKGLFVYDGMEHQHDINRHRDSPFDDEDTRSFYEDIPNLLDLVPTVVLGLTEQDVLELRKKQEEKAQDKGSIESDEGFEKDDGNDEDFADIDAEIDDRSVPEHNDSEDKPIEKEHTAFTNSYHHLADTFFSSMDSLVSRDRCDKAAIDFCYINSKTNRSRLVKLVFNVPRTHLELLPYYARLITTLQRVLKDNIAQELSGLLINEFNYFIKKRNQFRLESRVKNIRFLAELIKFHSCPVNIAYRCLKRCFADFEGHNIYVATSFLENCGRFLYCSKITHARTAHFLSIMMKLKSAKHLDPQAETLVQNAFYLCQPPVRKERVLKQYDPMYLFIRKQLYENVTDESGKRVIKLLRKLPWDTEPEKVRNFVIKAMLLVTRDKVMHMRFIADILKGISRFYDDIAIYIVDDVLEAIHHALDTNDYRQYQRTLGYAKFLGELFNRGFVHVKVVMETLYLIIHHSHKLSPLPNISVDQVVSESLDANVYRYVLVPHARYDPRVPSVLDSSRNVFRIRLVCALIESCTTRTHASRFGGHEKGLPRKKLERFLTFFQQYVLTKEEIPMETEFVLVDLYELLSRAWKEELVRLETWEEADAAVQAILAAEWTDTFMQHKNNVVVNGNSASFSPCRQKEPRIGNESAEEYLEDEEDCDEEEDDEEEAHGAKDEALHFVDPTQKNEEYEQSSPQEELEEDNFVVRDRYQITEEDKEFEQAFKSMLQSSVESRKLVSRVSVDKMAIPTMIKMKALTEKEDTLADCKRTESDNGVVFRILRRGNKGKVEARHVVIPEESSLAQHSHRQEDAGKKEQSELKRLVLQNMEREELLEITAPIPETDERSVLSAPCPRILTRSSMYESRATYGQGSEWNNAEFGLRRGRNYRGGR